jgi:hypothetical protein
MRARLRSLLLISQILLLGGCTPAVYLNLYNATEDALTVIKPHLRRVITIEPYTSVDVPLVLYPESTSRFMAIVTVGLTRHVRYFHRIQCTSSTPES